MAKDNFCKGNVSQPQLTKSLFKSLGDGTCEELTKKPSGKISFFVEKYCNDYPVFRMPAAIPLIVNSAPLNNSLRLYDLFDSFLSFINSLIGGCRV